MLNEGERNSQAIGGIMIATNRLGDFRCRPASSKSFADARPPGSGPQAVSVDAKPALGRLRGPERRGKIEALKEFAKARLDWRRRLARRTNSVSALHSIDAVISRLRACENAYDVQARWAAAAEKSPHRIGRPTTDQCQRRSKASARICVGGGCPRCSPSSRPFASGSNTGGSAAPSGSIIIVLIMTLARCCCVPTGCCDAREWPTALEKTSEQSDSEHWSCRKLARSCLSWL